MGSSAHRDQEVGHEADDRATFGLNDVRDDSIPKRAHHRPAERPPTTPMRSFATEAPEATRRHASRSGTSGSRPHGGMRAPDEGSARIPPIRHDLHIALRDGFRGHTVVIVVDGREVYRRAGVATDPTTARADTVDVTTESRVAHIAVSVTPGNIGASADLDVSAYPHVAISLVGVGTVCFEISPWPFRFL
jgi:hypothetical protein